MFPLIVNVCFCCPGWFLVLFIFHLAALNICLIFFLGNFHEKIQIFSINTCRLKYAEHILINFTFSLLSAILLGSIKVPYKELRRRIVEMDEDNLSAAMVEQLLKYMPDQDAINQLASLEGQYDQLAEPEQFCVVVRKPY